ncbi:MXAN_2562 family outer membrane beta-barrel protein [Haliangium ochraceum]|uniref:Uncharacterized protein n=1 Tax=Haliangium ochraceum (strain DSM 14365 / JCM 11303 / SMP-2) TaxID=502025 RepID=D0LWH8_HALO1|nr:MXAN_2562 family outer membrane beta-barrel protein [Haliangium ochraceum]ACY17628.1 hypothetical protein Hoch_5140 [Haliangium ochraceum DSM 14365]
MTSRVLVSLTALASLLFAEPAFAQDGSSAIDITVRLPNADSTSYSESNEVDRIDFFNYAHCVCSDEAEPGPSLFQVEVELLDRDYEFAADDAELQVGNDCNNDEEDQRDCETIADIGDVINDLDGAPRFSVRTRQFMFPGDDACQQEDGTSNIWLLFDDGNDGNIDEYFAVDYGYDAEPPPAPSGILAQPGESALNLSWDAIESRQDDVFGFQALCAKADGTPAFDSAKGEPLYDTAFQLCGSAAGADVFRDNTGVEVDAGSPSSGDLPSWMSELDPRYLCGTSGAQNAQSLRIEGLENGTSYRVALLVVDDARNVVAVDLGEGTPSEVVDFWEDYHDQGGGADGGFCLVTSTFGDGSGMTQALRDFRDGTLASTAAGRALTVAYYRYVAPLGAAAERSALVRAAAAAVLAPLAAAAAFWEYTGPLTKLLVFAGLLLLWRRRRANRAARAGRAEDTRRERGPRRPLLLQPRAAGALALALLLGLGAQAAAQSDPYWDTFDPVVEDEGPLLAPSPWNVALKFGPYLPDIDSEFGDGEGPYQRMFGSKGFLGGADIEYFFLHPMGQLGVFGGLGYTTESANAYATCGAGDSGCTPGMPQLDDDGDPVRVDGDQTSFHMIPLALGAVYRFTYLDDAWNVPVVPYARAGLSYYLWWFTRPDGSFSEAPTDECPSFDGCDGDPARGASLGYQASLGVAVRAERLDPQAARSMRNDLGIEHAGFFAEVLYAQVDGFGADSKLSLGDLTWFGGINFEF